MRRLAWMALVCSTPALAGPPYIADDPEPTDFRHYEIYLFATGESNRGGRTGAAGIDFNYGGEPDLQLTAVLPVVDDHASGERARTGIGNIELAAKYRFVHQKETGWDVAIFPRLFLRSASRSVGEPHTTVLLPLWVEKDWPGWSTFGGGGWFYHRGGEAQDFYLVAWALAHQFTNRLQLGAEVQHQTPDTRGGKTSTGIGVGMRYDLDDRWHWLAYAAPGVQNAPETARYAWFTSILFTY
jgi:hypothetical protein